MPLSLTSAIEVHVEVVVLLALLVLDVLHLVLLERAVVASDVLGVDVQELVGLVTKDLGEQVVEVDRLTPDGPGGVDPVLTVLELDDGSDCVPDGSVG